MDIHDHRIMAIPVLAAAGSGPIFNGRCLLIGWSIADTSALANLITIREGQDATSQAIAVAALTASGSSTVSTGFHGVEAKGGLSITQAGAAVGSIYVLPLSH